MLVAGGEIVLQGKKKRREEEERKREGEGDRFKREELV